MPWLSSVQAVDREKATSAVAQTEANVMANSAGAVKLELRLIGPESSTVWSSVTLSTYREEDNEWHCIAHPLDVTAARRNAELLAYNAKHDDLTGMPNSALLGEYVDGALKRGDKCVAVVHLDLDDFRVISDAMGAAFSDQVISDVAARLHALLPRGTVARVGTNEFVLIAEVQGPEALAGDMADAIAVVEIGGEQVHLSACLGIALAQPGDTAADLLRDAATALHEAKRSGRGHVVTYTTDMRDNLDHRVIMQAALRRGLDRGEIRPYFQPILSLAGGGIVKAKALVRSCGDEGGGKYQRRSCPRPKRADSCPRSGPWSCAMRSSSVPRCASSCRTFR